LVTTNDIKKIIGKSSFQYIGSKDNQEFYFIGIIDYLQIWNIKKIAELKVKSITVERNNLSVIPPKEYSLRFFNFMTKNLLPLNIDLVDDKIGSNKYFMRFEKFKSVEKVNMRKFTRFEEKKTFLNQEIDVKELIVEKINEEKMISNSQIISKNEYHIELKKNEIEIKNIEKQDVKLKKNENETKIIEKSEIKNEPKSNFVDVEELYKNLFFQQNKVIENMENIIFNQNTTITQLNNEMKKLIENNKSFQDLIQKHDERIKILENSLIKKK
jgi:uncharacterized coiled-coil protein SlyX